MGLTCRAALVVLAMFAIVGTANATVIYDNGAPANDTGYNFFNPSSADDFILSSDSSVTGVTFWAYSDDVANLASIGWGFATDAGGAPGVFFQTGLAAPSSIIDTGVDLSSFDVYEVTFSVSGVSLLGGTTYWLALDSGPLGLNDQVGFSGWVFTTGVTGNTALFGDPAGSWSSSLTRDNAFQLQGVVPEPTTASLLGLGVVAMAVARRPRRSSVERGPCQASAERS